MNFPFIYNDYVDMMGTVSILKKRQKGEPFTSDRGKLSFSFIS
ncbi:hypothetical protein B4119_3687 [Parageobacillus caldoxylosilyticus]|uniref:Uncharacterized protein n=1 Tax=Saccharococcus caldoxylosilyticus TaxID=81408 RepID=A0A150LG20_9BACL|nr:hypothetical protein B4119_3687 [Parageobacillus caldoxylosilyticus]